MKYLHATLSASISELKKNPSSLIDEAKGEPIAILNHNKPTAYLVPAEYYAAMIEQLDEIALSNIVKERMLEKSGAVKVNLDDL